MYTHTLSVEHNVMYLTHLYTNLQSLYVHICMHVSCIDFHPPFIGNEALMLVGWLVTKLRAKRANNMHAKHTEKNFLPHP